MGFSAITDVHQGIVYLNKIYNSVYNSLFSCSQTSRSFPLLLIALHNKSCITLTVATLALDDWLQSLPLASFGCWARSTTGSSKITCFCLAPRLDVRTHVQSRLPISYHLDFIDFVYSDIVFGDKKRECTTITL